ncbi:MAG: AAA family ATPase [Methanosarcinales archaeon]
MSYKDELESASRREYEKYERIAEEAMKNEDYTLAAKAYRRAGNALLRVAEITENKKLSEKMRLKSLNLINAAKDLDNGIIPTKKSEPLKNYKKRERAIPKKETGDSGDEVVDSEKEFEKYIEENLISKSKVTWSAIGGLDEVKRLIKESVVLSIIEGRPDAVKPWKGILLFGPPGTGKTLLASATAGSLQATFFNVKVSNVLSKYFGESSKIVSALYDVARNKAPSIVFLDEFDSIALSRSGEVAESSRRVLSTLLSELDGLQDKDSSKYILTMAATNTPWDLDAAVLSRFPKRIHIPLPDKSACKEIIRIHTIKKGLKFEEKYLDELADKCVEKLFAGRDIKTLCNDAIWNMVRQENPDLSALADKSLNEIKNYKLKTRDLKIEDFEKSFEVIESAVKEKDLIKYEQWEKDFGSG